MYVGDGSPQSKLANGVFLSRRHLELYFSFIELFLMALGSLRKDPTQPDPV